MVIGAIKYLMDFVVLKIISSFHPQVAMPLPMMQQPRGLKTLHQTVSRLVLWKQDGLPNLLHLISIGSLTKEKWRRFVTTVLFIFLLFYLLRASQNYLIEIKTEIASVKVYIVILVLNHTQFEGTSMSY